MSIYRFFERLCNFAFDFFIFYLIVCFLVFLAVLIFL